MENISQAFAIVNLGSLRHLQIMKLFTMILAFNVYYISIHHMTYR